MPKQHDVLSTAAKRRAARSRKLAQTRVRTDTTGDFVQPEGGGRVDAALPHFPGKLPSKRQDLAVDAIVALFIGLDDPAVLGQQGRPERIELSQAVAVVVALPQHLHRQQAGGIP